MAAFVLQNNYFEFNGENKPQTSSTAIGTRFTYLHMHIYSWIKLNQNF